MVNQLIPVLTLLCGLSAGVVVVWLILRGKIAAEFERGRKDGQTELAAMNERLAGRESNIFDLKTEIAGLKSEIEKREAAFRDIQKQITELSTRGGQLETALQQERRQAAEKLALLETAKQQLTDAFKGAGRRRAEEQQHVVSGIGKNAPRKVPGIGQGRSGKAADGHR